MPSTFSSVLTCWTKLSCLFDVDAQKSSRTTVRLCALGLALGVDDRDRRLLPERRIGEHHVEPLARVGPQRVVDVDRAVGLGRLDAVQQQVHRAQPGGVVDDLPAGEQPRAEVALLVGVEVGWCRQDVLVGGEEEAAGAAGRVADPSCPGSGCITSTIAEISARGVKYWPAPDFMSAAFFSSRPS